MIKKEEYYIEKKTINNTVFFELSERVDIVNMKWQVIGHFRTKENAIVYIEDELFEACEILEFKDNNNFIDVIGIIYD